MAIRLIGPDQARLSRAGYRRCSMHKLLVILTPFLALVASAPVLAQGDIGTISRGTYVCELPGNALGEARGQVGTPQPEAGFSIVSDSRYSSPQGPGTYLRRGSTVSFTSGPRNGESYTIVGRDFLRRIEANGQPGRMRCLRQG